jgi:glycine cleavage system transcriptional repressor
VSGQVVLTAIGADRVGLVDEVSEFVLARGGNVEDSRMVNLHGQFAIVMLVRGGETALDRLRADLDTLRSESRVHAQLVPAAAEHAPQPGLPFRLTGRALDQPGLVHSVAHLLRGLNVSIESMDTTLEAAPITGAPVFAMQLLVAVPTDTPVARLREELAAICDPLNIDWHLAAL